MEVVAAMRNKKRDEKATVNLRVYPSTHRLLVELAAKLYTSQAEAVDVAVREALERLQEGRKTD